MRVRFANDLLDRIAEDTLDAVRQFEHRVIHIRTTAIQKPAHAAENAWQKIHERHARKSNFQEKCVTVFRSELRSFIELDHFTVSMKQ